MPTQYDADVIIIGSGALGANAAHELARQGHSVIILEAGKSIPRWQIVDSFRNSPRKENNNDPYPNESWAPTSYQEDYLTNLGSFEFKPGTLKLVGGTTWHWAAACWRYLPNDMMLKTMYGIGRDWPMEYDELEPYYVRAEYALGVSGSNIDDQSGQAAKPYPLRSREYPVEPEDELYIFQRLKKRLEPFGFNFIHEPNAHPTISYDGRPACRGNNNCMPICPIGTIYTGSNHVEKAVAKGAKLITEATVDFIEKGTNGKIIAVNYKSFGKKDTRLTARYFIVAAHSLETAKLLLLSDVANSSDQVGRNLMGHSGKVLQFFADEPLWMGRGPIQQGGIVNWRDGNFRREHSAMKHSIMNQAPNQVATERLIKLGVIGKELNERIFEDTSKWVTVSTVLETLPLSTNTIRPNFNKKDALGIPMLLLNYNRDNYTNSVLPILLDDYKKILKGMNGEIIDIGNWKNFEHIMGTVIMGDNPKDSVVDKFCRTYDHSNLFLATTGVIPATGVVNPTLTGVALSIRIADTIHQEL